MPELRKKQAPKSLPKPPAVRLAHVPGAQGDNNLLGQRGVEALPDQSLPALLVSYVYLEPFLVNRHRYRYRDWVLDSGAFSARNSGTEISLEAYIEKCRELLAEDPTLTEVFSLDVIGDWKATLTNTEIMWKAGIPAIPCYHFADRNWDVLRIIARDYPKIALGGMADLRGPKKKTFVEQCFARVWPKKIHGFGCSSEPMVLAFPWHSVDATNWEIGPCKYGQWRAFGGQRVSVRGSKQNLRAEVEWFLELERKARQRWRKEMEKLETLNSPSVRLAADAGAAGGRRIGKALGPSVYLSHGGDTIPQSNRGSISRVRAFGGDDRGKEGAPAERVKGVRRDKKGKGRRGDR